MGIQTPDPFSLPNAWAEVLNDNFENIKSRLTGITESGVTKSTGEFSGQLAIPVFEDDVSAPAATQYYNSTEEVVKYKDGNGGVIVEESLWEDSEGVLTPTTDEKAISVNNVSIGSDENASSFNDINNEPIVDYIDTDGFIPASDLGTLQIDLNTPTSEYWILEILHFEDTQSGGGNPLHMFVEGLGDSHRYGMISVDGSSLSYATSQSQFVLLDPNVGNDYMTLSGEFKIQKSRNSNNFHIFDGGGGMSGDSQATMDYLHSGAVQGTSLSGTVNLKFRSPGSGSALLKAALKRSVDRSEI